MKVVNQLIHYPVYGNNGAVVPVLMPIMAVLYKSVVYVDVYYVDVYGSLIGTLNQLWEVFVINCYEG